MKIDSTVTRRVEIFDIRSKFFIILKERMTKSVTLLLLIIEKLLMCQDSLLQISVSFSQIKR